MPTGDMHSQKALTRGSITWPYGTSTPPWTSTPPAQWTYMPAPKDDYANLVEVEEGEHDAVLRFYRKRGAGKALVKEITVPLSALAALRAPTPKKKG